MAQTNQGSRNNEMICIPVDILAIIFDEYAKAETIEYPIETLMLVCKAWKDTCLYTRNLWSKFRLRIETGPEAKQCAARVKRRLARSGGTTPISIQFYHSLAATHEIEEPEIYSPRSLSWPSTPSPKPPVICPAYDIELRPRDSFEAITSNTLSCPCVQEIRSSVISMMDLLAGSEGRYCQRWTSLDIHPGDILIADEIFKFLKYPTPILQSIRLHAVFTGQTIKFPIFPRIPRLHQLSIIRSHVNSSVMDPLIAATSHIQHLHLDESESCFKSEQTYAFTNVKELVLGKNPYRIKMSLPNLQALTLDMSPVLLGGVPSSQHLPFEQITRLGLFYRSHLYSYNVYGLELVYRLIDFAVVLLERTKALEFIRGDEPSMFLVIKALRTARLTQLETSRLYISIISEDDRMESINAGSSVDYGKCYEVDLGLRMISDIEKVEAEMGWQVINSSLPSIVSIYA